MSDSQFNKNLELDKFNHWLSQRNSPYQVRQTLAQSKGVEKCNKKMELGNKQVVVFNYLTKIGFEKVRRDKVDQIMMVKVTIH